MILRKSIRMHHGCWIFRVGSKYIEERVDSKLKMSETMSKPVNKALFFSYLTRNIQEIATALIMLR